MKTFPRLLTKRETAFLSLALGALLCSSSRARAQLGATNFGGIQINALSVSYGGDTRDLDCHVTMELGGPAFAGAVKLSPPRVVSAVDDAGLDLVRHKARTGWTDFPATRTSDGFIQTLKLKSPSTAATAIWDLEWETDVLKDGPEAGSETIRLKLHRVRLIDPPQLEVTARRVTRDVRAKDGQLNSWMLLVFAGGPVRSSAGIRTLWIHEATTDLGQELALSEWSRSGMQWFSAIDPHSGSGRIISKGIGFELPDPDTLGIRRISGEAEFFFPTPANGGRVEFPGFIERVGEPLRDAAFDRCGIRLTFLGRENFETKRKESYTNRIRFVSTVPSGLSDRVRDSLLFALDDPEQRLVELTFTDENGVALKPENRVIQMDFRAPRTDQLTLYSFKEPPPPGTRLIATVATPESLRRVPFKAENIPLP